MANPESPDAIDTATLGRLEALGYTRDGLKKMFAKAEGAGRREIASPRAVRSAAYLPPPRHELLVTLGSGAAFLVPVGLIDELASATPEQLAGVAVSPLRDGLRWDSLDVHICASGLLAELFGGIDPVAAGRKGGSQRSRAKTQASRENGKMGGRPRKVRS